MTARLRFLADRNVGSLARWLRLLGFDTAFADDLPDPDLLLQSIQEGRTLLTRDRGLKERDPSRVFLVVPETLEDQIVVVLETFSLWEVLEPFTRCAVCNGLLQPAPASEVREEVPPRVLEQQDRFWRCGGCRNLYWKGGHWARLQKKVQNIRRQRTLKGDRAGMIE